MYTAQKASISLGGKSLYSSVSRPIQGAFLEAMPTVHVQPACPHQSGPRSQHAWDNNEALIAKVAGHSRIFCGGMAKVLSSSASLKRMMIVRDQRLMEQFQGGIHG